MRRITPKELVQYQRDGIVSRLPPPSLQMSPSQLLLTLAIYSVGLGAVSGLSGDHEFTAIVALTTAAILSLVHRKFWVAVATLSALTTCTLVTFGYFNAIDWQPRISRPQLLFGVAIYVLGLSVPRRSNGSFRRKSRIRQRAQLEALNRVDNGCSAILSRAGAILLSVLYW